MRGFGLNRCGDPRSDRPHMLQKRESSGGSFPQFPQTMAFLLPCFSTPARIDGHAAGILAGT
jgi:hypothetical protein